MNKSYVSFNMILNVVPKWSPNAPLEASQWARRPQDGSRGDRMVSMKLQEPLKDPQDGPRRSQDGSYGPQHDPKNGQDASKGTQGGPKMTLRWPQEESKGVKLGPKMKYIVRFKKH